jgi:hypothetical protein
MPNPLRRAIKSGIRMNDQIGNLFAQIGTENRTLELWFSSQEDGRRVFWAHLAQGFDGKDMKPEAALAKDNPLPAVREVLRNLRRQVQADVSSVFSDAAEMGAEEAQRQMRFYETKPRGSVTLTEQTNTVTETVMSKFDAQSAAITALVLSQADPLEIIGNEERTGLLSSGEITAAAAYWGAHLVWASFDAQVEQGNTENAVFMKQAVAALDARTTDCCLRVHGQIQSVDEPFHLTGTPRFADYMDWPGFHWYCRTSGVLYQEEFDDGLTGKMREGAQFFLNEREAGRTPDNYPVDAFK